MTQRSPAAKSSGGLVLLQLVRCGFDAVIPHGNLLGEVAFSGGLESGGFVKPVLEKTMEKVEKTGLSANEARFPLRFPHRRDTLTFIFTELFFIYFLYLLFYLLSSDRCFYLYFYLDLNLYLYININGKILQDSGLNQKAYVCCRGNGPVRQSRHTLLRLLSGLKPLTRKGHAASVCGRAANGCAVAGLAWEPF